MTFVLIALFASAASFVIYLTTRNYTPQQWYVCQLWQWYTYHVDLLEWYDEGTDEYLHHLSEANFFNSLIQTCDTH